MRTVRRRAASGILEMIHIMRSYSTARTVRYKDCARYMFVSKIRTVSGTGVLTSLELGREGEGGGPTHFLHCLSNTSTCAEIG